MWYFTMKCEQLVNTILQLLVEASVQNRLVCQHLGTLIIDMMASEATHTKWSGKVSGHFQHPVIHNHVVAI